MKVVKNIFITLFLLLLLISASVFYAFKIEPFRIKVNQFTINEENAGLSPIKLVQISDLHIKEDFTYENLNKIVIEVNKQDPDILLFTGDLYDNYAKYKDDENIIAELQKINAKYAKIAIWGNRDYGGGASRKYQDIMEQSGFILLKNENHEVVLDNGKSIYFTALDDSLLGNPVMPETTALSDSDVGIFLTHEPDTVDAYMNYSYDIALSGHSHGGQVNIPFFPSINEKAVEETSLSTKYSGGMYQLSEDSIKKLYVNTGIGTTHISARFGVVPEIAVFQIFL